MVTSNNEKEAERAVPPWEELLPIILSLSPLSQEKPCICSMYLMFNINILYVKAKKKKRRRTNFM